MPLVRIRFSAFCFLLSISIQSIFPNTSTLLYHIERITGPAPYIYVAMTRKGKPKTEGQVDWNGFSHQPGARVNSNLADSSRSTNQALSHI